MRASAGELAADVEDVDLNETEWMGYPGVEGGSESEVARQKASLAFRTELENMREVMKLYFQQISSR